jgi:hypothetical protein
MQVHHYGGYRLALILAFSHPPPPRLWRIFEEKE